MKIKKVNDPITPTVLILSNRLDFTTDYVTSHLHEMGVSYFRLNRDQFANHHLSLSVYPPSLSIRIDGTEVQIDACKLKSVYFRAPVFLRETGFHGLSPDDQFSKSQWAAFVRAMMIFSDARWMNHPQATYQAEAKPLQLRIAAEIGFRIPETRVTNCASEAVAVSRDGQVVGKCLDSIVLKFDEDDEGFIYTQFLDTDRIANGTIQSAPAIYQQPLFNKIDYRVTVVENQIFPVQIVDASVVSRFLC